jgi:hypothetical protein
MKKIFHRKINLKFYIQYCKIYLRILREDDTTWNAMNI